MSTARDLINGTYAAYSPNKDMLYTLSNSISLETLTKIIHLASGKEEYACIDAERGQKCQICLSEGLDKLIYIHDGGQHCNTCYVAHIIECNIRALISLQ